MLKDPHARLTYSHMEKILKKKKKKVKEDWIEPEINEKDTISDQQRYFYVLSNLVNNQWLLGLVLTMIAFWVIYYNSRSKPNANISEN